MPTFTTPSHALARSLAAALAGAALIGASAPAQDNEVEIIESVEDGSLIHVRGWLELARVQPADLLLRAKLDTGALTSAIHAEILRGPAGYGYPETLEDDEDVDSGPSSDEDDVETIVFALESRRGTRVVFEREIVRWVNIKNRGGGTHSRPVVMMEFCIGGVRVHGQVGLADRSEFNYPLLVGRRMLTAGGIVVDPSNTFTYESRCYADGPRRNED